MSPRLFLALPLLLAGCAGYDPPMAGDHAAPRYQADLLKCRKQADVKARQVSGASPQSAIRAVFASDAPEHRDVAACMQSRGYKPG